MNKQIVFISGAMSGIEDMNRKAFYKAQKHLERSGFIVLNPAVYPDGLELSEYLKLCFCMIDIADIVYVLRNSENSVGSKAEVNYANDNEKTVVYQYEVEKETCALSQGKSF